VQPATPQGPDQVNAFHFISVPVAVEHGLVFSVVADDHPRRESKVLDRWNPHHLAMFEPIKKVSDIS
jgi:hypothetical protein